jgi:glucose 1-dehydrogenase
MLAVGMLKNESGVHGFEIPKPGIKNPNDVLIRMIEVGLDGTDFNTVRYNLQDVAHDRNEIVLGHEGVGIVEEIGLEVKSVAPGDIVVITVRRGCGECEPCARNQSDLCLTGNFTERGIHKVDGLLTEYIVDQEQYVVKVPPEAQKLAVLTEPVSIVEKGIEELRIIQSRVPWYCPHYDHGWMSDDWGGCKVALVVGAGPLGLLAATLISKSKAYTYVIDIVPEDHYKARLVNDIGAHYIDGRGKTPEEIVHFCCTPTGHLNLIFEASGAAEEAIRLIPFMSRTSIYTMTGIPRGDMEIELDAALLVRRIVRYNQVIMGSVNSNRRHFEMALRDINGVNEHFNHVLEEMITHRFKLEDYQKAFSLEDPKHIKTVMQISPWSQNKADKKAASSYSTG